MRPARTPPEPTASSRLAAAVRRRWRSGALCLLVAGAYLALNPMFLVRATDSSSATYKTALVLFHVLALSLVLVLARCSRRVAYPLLAALLASAVVDNVTLSAKQSPMTLSDLAVLTAAAGSVGDAVREFAGEIGRACAFAALLALGVVALRRSGARWRWAVPAAGVLTVVPFAMFAGIAVRYGEPALVGFPSTNVVPHGGGVLLLDAVAKAWSPPRRVSAARAPAAPPDQPRHIVLVIDESVEAERFAEANGRTFRSAVDLGAAFSATNCSAETNLILRYAVDAADITTQTQPLFQLAREAGFTTLYVDLQEVLHDVSVRNYFSRQELSFVDRILEGEQFGPVPTRDRALLPRLPLVLAEHERTFTIVNKVGSHFPYARRLPPELRGASDPYLASITFSSVEFIHELEAGMPASTVVFYTSDHGQNFGARSTHCNPLSTSALSEWRVPLVVLASPDVAGLLRRVDAGWAGKASHFEVGETLRVLLGYGPLFNRTLFDAPHDDSTTYRAYYGPPGGVLLVPPRYREFARGSLRGGALLAGDHGVQRRE
jgi:lipid A ethanolaminephosphotransferase